jgi:predicted outer membrane repeat protein
VAVAPAASAAPTVDLYVNKAASPSSTSCTQASPCLTIKKAITKALTFTGDYVVIFVGPGVYDEHDSFNAGALSSLAIDGSGASFTTIDAQGTASVLRVTGGTVYLDGLTLTGGKATWGGGLYVAGSSTVVNLFRGTISNNSATYGGGVYDSSAGVEIASSTVSDDTATFGGGVYVSAGDLLLHEDTLANDTTAFSGGGLFASHSLVSTRNDTFFNDQAGGSGGAAYILSSILGMQNDTLAHNSATTSGGGIYAASSTISYGNSIFDANSPRSCDFAGGTSITDNGYNVASDSTNVCSFGLSSIFNSSTIDLASSLATNGSSGPETLAITTNSSAFEEVPPSACTLHFDERDLPRPGYPGNRCDAGAFELQSAPIVCLSPSPLLTLIAPLGGVSPVGHLVVHNCGDAGGGELTLKIPMATLSSETTDFTLVSPSASGTFPACNPSTPLSRGQGCSLGVIFKAGSHSFGTIEYAAIFVNTNGVGQGCEQVAGVVGSGVPFPFPCVF